MFRFVSTSTLLLALCLQNSGAQVLLDRWVAPVEETSSSDFEAYSGVWGYTDNQGNEYALFCNSLGLNIIDVTIPTEAVRVVSDGILSQNIEVRYL